MTRTAKVNTSKSVTPAYPVGRIANAATRHR